MAIEVTCPRGHVLLVKDKYAGKTGCCPHCNSRVFVPVPAKVSEEDILEFVGPASSSAETPADDDDESVYEHPQENADAGSSSGLSLLGSGAQYEDVPELQPQGPHLARHLPARCDHFFDL